MADAQGSTHQDGAVVLDEAPEGIVGFSARHTAAKDFQAVSVEVDYRFARPLDYIDAVQRFGDVQAQAEEQAETKLADTLARRQAQTAAVQPQAAPAPRPAAPAPAAAPQAQQPRPPHPADTGQVESPASEEEIAAELGGQLQHTQQPGGLPVSVGTSPKGAQVRYVPSTHLSRRAFEDAIRQQIGRLGFDEDEFAVFDNRSSAGPYPGFEQGGENYTSASVKARNDGRAQKVLDKKTAFYVDFDDAGVLTVKASKDAESYKAAAAAFA